MKCLWNGGKGSRKLQLKFNQEKKIYIKQEWRIQRFLERERKIRTKGFFETEASSRKGLSSEKFLNGNQLVFSTLSPTFWLQIQEFVFYSPAKREKLFLHRKKR